MTYQLKDCDNLGLFIACRALELDIEKADKLITSERTSFGERLEFEAVIKMIEAKNLLDKFDNVERQNNSLNKRLKKYYSEDHFQDYEKYSDQYRIAYFIKKYGPVISLPQYYVLQSIKQFFSDNGHKDDSGIFDVKYDRNEYRLGTLNYNENNISLSILLMALNVNKDKTKELIGKYRNDFDKQTEFILVITMIKEMNLFDAFTIEEYEDNTLSEYLNKYSGTGGLKLGQSYSDRDRLDHFLDQYKEPLSRKHLYAFHRIRDFLRANDLKDESAMLNIQIKENDYKIEDLDITADNIGFGIVLCALQIPLHRAKKLIEKENLGTKTNPQKKIEFDASIKLIRAKELFECFSKESYESEALNNVIRTHWDKELLTNGTDQQRIKSMISHSDSNISLAQMNAIFRFKELLVWNGYTEESVLLDVKYKCGHIRYICGSDQQTYDIPPGHDIDHIVPFKLLQHVWENLGYNVDYAANFAVHFDQSYNKQYLSINGNRGKKPTEINKFLKDNTIRGYLVKNMIDQYQNTIRNKVQESINKFENSEYKETNQACLDELDKLLGYKKDEVSELEHGVAAINIQQ